MVPDEPQELCMDDLGEQEVSPTVPPGLSMRNSRAGKRFSSISLRASSMRLRVAAPITPVTSMRAMDLRERGENGQTIG